MHKSSHEEIKIVRAIKPDNHGTGTVTGEDIDTKGFREFAIGLDVAAIASGATCALKLQESDVSGVSLADITGAAITTITAANKQAIIRLNLENRKRYIRPVATVAVGAIDMGAVAVLSNPVTKPVTQSAAETKSV